MEPAAKERIAKLERENELLRQANEALSDGMSTVGIGYVMALYHKLREELIHHGGRIGSLESDRDRLVSRVDKASAAHEAMKTRVSRIEVRTNGTPQAASKKNAAQGQPRQTAQTNRTA